MALNPRDREVVTIGVDFETNTKAIVREIGLFSQSLTKNMRRNQKAAERMGKGAMQAWKMFQNSKETLGNLKKLTTQLDEVEKGIEAVAAKKALLPQQLADL